MLSILVLFLVAALLIAVAIIFFIIGFTYGLTKSLKELRQKGWTITPPAESESGE